MICLREESDHSKSNYGQLTCEHYCMDTMVAKLNCFVSEWNWMNSLKSSNIRAESFLTLAIFLISCSILFIHFDAAIPSQNPPRPIGHNANNNFKVNLKITIEFWHQWNPWKIATCDQGKTIQSQNILNCACNQISAWIFPIEWKPSLFRIKKQFSIESQTFSKGNFAEDFSLEIYHIGTGNSKASSPKPVTK